MSLCLGMFSLGMGDHRRNQAMRRACLRARRPIQRARTDEERDSRRVPFTAGCQSHTQDQDKGKQNGLLRGPYVGPLETGAGNSGRVTNEELAWIAKTFDLCMAMDQFACSIRRRPSSRRPSQPVRLLQEEVVCRRLFHRLLKLLVF